LQDVYVALQLAKLLTGRDRDPPVEVIWEKKALDLNSEAGVEAVHVDDAVMRLESGKCIYVQVKEASPSGGWSAKELVHRSVAQQFWQQWLAKEEEDRPRTFLRLAVEWTNRGFTAPILRQVITRISEVHDLGTQRFKFYDTTKDWAASPPETLLVADKNVKAHRIQNVVLPIYSTNHKTDGVYLPDEDRRHYVARSPRSRADFQQPYWRNYWDQWGYEIERDDERKDEFWRGYWHHIKLGADYHVVAYLSQPELIEGFNPGATPPHTPAWHEIVAANRNPQDAELLDVLEAMGEPWWNDPKPDAVTIAQIIAQPECPQAIIDFFRDPKNSRAWRRERQREDSDCRRVAAIASAAAQAASAL